MELLSDLAREDSFSQCRQCLLSHAGGEGFLTWLCTYTYAAVQAAQQVGAGGVGRLGWEVGKGKVASAGILAWIIACTLSYNLRSTNLCFEHGKEGAQMCRTSLPALLS